MANFSRRTILAALDTWENLTHPQIDRYLLEWGLEKVAPVEAGSKPKRVTVFASFLLEDPKRKDQDGRNLIDAIVEERIHTAIASCTSYDGFEYQRFQEKYVALHRGLERDGFTVEDGQLRRTLPEALDLPQADDEVHALLDAYGLTTPKGHLDQAINAHSRGEWAAANAQLRPFVEGLLDEIAEILNGAALGLPPTGHQRRQWLHTRTRHFLSALLMSGLTTGRVLLKPSIGACTHRGHIQGSLMKTTQPLGFTLCFL